MAGELITLTARHQLWKSHSSYKDVFDFLHQYMNDTKLSIKESMDIADNILLGKMKFIGSTQKHLYLAEDACNIQEQYNIETENLEDLFFNSIKDKSIDESTFVCHSS